MNQIGALISQLCPKGVAYVELDALFNLRKGENLTNDQAIPGEFPVITASRGSTFFHNDFNFDGEYLTISSHGAYAGFVSYYNQKFWLGNNVYLFETKTEAISTRFYFHVLKSLAQVLLGTVNTGGIPYINAKDLKRLRVPQPPIEIQREIVRILDTFTELEVELEAELEARKSQYEHLSKKLLDFSDTETQQVAVSDICRVSRGTVISKDYLRDHPGSFPVYSSQTLNNGIFGYIDTFAYDFESLTWTTDGANAGSIFFHQNEKFTITNVCGLLQVLDPTRVSTRFLYYVLSVEAPKYVSAGMGNPKLMAGTMGEIQIELPSLEKQEEIVAILDKFDALVNGMTEGLPAEIAARRTQYEYYQSKLLAFKKLEVA